MRDVVFANEASQAAFEEFDAQGRIAPGTEGWWTVYGVRAHDIEAGDLVMTKDGEEGLVDVALIEGLWRSKHWPMRVGVVIGGEQMTYGAGNPVTVLRRGTGATLSESVS